MAYTYNPSTQGTEAGNLQKLKGWDVAQWNNACLAGTNHQSSRKEIIWTLALLKARIYIFHKK